LKRIATSELGCGPFGGQDPGVFEWAQCHVHHGLVYSHRVKPLRSHDPDQLANILRLRLLVEKGKTDREVGDCGW